MSGRAPARRGASAVASMLLATLLFALMGVCVKAASAHYAPGEIVFYRGLVGALAMAGVSAWQGVSLRTSRPGMHFWRSASGVTSLTLWFYAIGGLPLATAMTLNYMSSVWMALFLVGGAIAVGGERVDGRLVATVLLGFVGVGLILRPTIEQDQLWHGLLGLLSGLLAALAYLQVTALGRAGEPDTRIVFYFSLGGMAVGLIAALAGGGLRPHGDAFAALMLLLVGLFATSAQWLMTRAYAIGRPLVNASLQYLGIAYAFVFGVLLFDDPVRPMALAGMGLVVVAGLAATRLRTVALPKGSPAARADTLES